MNIVGIFTHLVLLLTILFNYAIFLIIGIYFCIEQISTLLPKCWSKIVKFCLWNGVFVLKLNICKITFPYIVLFCLTLRTLAKIILTDFKLNKYKRNLNGRRKFISKTVTAKKLTFKELNQLKVSSIGLLIEDNQIYPNPIIYINLDNASNGPLDNKLYRSWN